MHECDTIYRETALQRGHLKKFIEHNICVGITFYIHYNSHTFAVAFIIDVADAINTFLIDKFCNRFDQI